MEEFIGGDIEIITTKDIEIYCEIADKIDAIIQFYYAKFIDCNYTYDCEGWTILDDNKSIRISYSYIDYNDERCYDDVTLTWDELISNLKEYEYIK